MSGSLPAFAPGQYPTVDWLFLDLNSYFASVEQQDRPELRGRPVGVVAVDTDSTCVMGESPSFIMAPSPNCLDICLRTFPNAFSSAKCLSPFVHSCLLLQMQVYYIS